MKTEDRKHKMMLSVFENWNKERVDDENKNTIISIHVSSLIYVPPCVCFRLLEGCARISRISLDYCQLDIVTHLLAFCLAIVCTVSERKLCFSISHKLSTPADPNTLYISSA